MFNSARRSCVLRSVVSVVNICFLLSYIAPMRSYAQTPAQLGLPVAGTMISLTPAYVPVIAKGLRVHPDNPMLFDFILDTGDSGLKAKDPALKAESEKIIKYFLASLTIPDDDQWVNLSPYEKDRIVPEQLGQTDMGRDMLAQDYILKQLTASLIYPENTIGKEFWDRVYAKARQLYGSSQVPVNTFNKVWIVADKARVFVRNNTAFIVGAHLKVMLEEDYLSLEKHNGIRKTNSNTNNAHAIGNQIIREIILPELEQEVNTGKHFADLRQIFYSMILSVWYKKNLKEALLNQVYSNKSKINGVDLQDKTIKERIYQEYLKAYKKGVFNYIKEDIDKTSHDPMPRKYFSGGVFPRVERSFSQALTVGPNEAGAFRTDGEYDEARFMGRVTGNPSAAMVTHQFDIKGRGRERVEYKYTLEYELAPGGTVKEDDVNSILVKLFNELPMALVAAQGSIFRSIGNHNYKTQFSSPEGSGEEINQLLFEIKGGNDEVLVKGTVKAEAVTDRKFTYGIGEILDLLWHNFSRKHFRVYTYGVKQGQDTYLISLKESLGLQLFTKGNEGRILNVVMPRLKKLFQDEELSVSITSSHQLSVSIATKTASSAPSAAMTAQQVVLRDETTMPLTDAKRIYRALFNIWEGADADEPDPKSQKLQRALELLLPFAMGAENATSEVKKQVRDILVEKDYKLLNIFLSQKGDFLQNVALLLRNSFVKGISENWKLTNPLMGESRIAEESTLLQAGDIPYLSFEQLSELEAIAKGIGEYSSTNEEVQGRIENLGFIKVAGDIVPAQNLKALLIGKKRIYTDKSGELGPVTLEAAKRAIGDNGKGKSMFTFFSKTTGEEYLLIAASMPLLLVGNVANDANQKAVILNLGPEDEDFEREISTKTIDGKRELIVVADSGKTEKPFIRIRAKNQLKMAPLTIESASKVIILGGFIFVYGKTLRVYAIKQEGNQLAKELISSVVVRRAFESVNASVSWTETALTMAVSEKANFELARVRKIQQFQLNVNSESEDAVYFIPTDQLLRGLKAAVSKAMIAIPHSTAADGGIDLNAKDMAMSVAGEKISMAFDPILINQFKRGDFSGIRPEFIDMASIGSVYSFLGIKR